MKVCFGPYDWLKALIAAVLLALVAIALLQACSAPIRAVAPTLAAPASGANVPVGTIGFSGTAAPNADIQVVVNGSVCATTRADNDGNWRVNGIVERLGPATIVARQLSANVRSSDSLPLNLVVGAAGTGSLLQLAAPLVQAPAAPYAPGKLTLAGTGTPNSLAEIFVDGKSVGTAQVGADGRWTLPTELPNGLYRVSANAVGDAGQLIATGYAANVPVGDRQLVAAVAAAPVVQAPAAPYAPGKLTLAGTGTPNSLAEIFVDGKLVGTAQVGADGRWTLPTELPNGLYRVSANAVGAAGQLIATGSATNVPVGDGQPVAAAQATAAPTAVAAAQATAAPTQAPATAAPTAAATATSAATAAPTQAPATAAPTSAATATSVATATAAATSVATATAAATAAPTQAVATAAPTQAPAAATALASATPGGAVIPSKLPTTGDADSAPPLWPAALFGLLGLSAGAWLLRRARAARM